MIKRFLVAAIVVALFLGGVGYFNLVFKPAMIKEFVGKVAPPAVPVTAERAGTEVGRPGEVDRHADGYPGHRRGA